MAKHFSLRNRRICDKWVELSLKSSKSPNEEISLIKKNYNTNIRRVQSVKQRKQKEQMIRDSNWYKTDIKIPQ